MAICRRCFRSVMSDEKFCGNCGTRLEKTIAGNSSKSSASFPDRLSMSDAEVTPNFDVRALFVVGAKTDSDSTDWLTKKYPASQVIKFSTIGAVREVVLRLARSKTIEYLCLIGSAETVPPDRLGDDHESIHDKRNQQKFKLVESDIHYCVDRYVVHNIPSYEETKYSSTMMRRLSRVDPEHIAGVIPVGRIPFDDPNIWRSYLERLDEDYTDSESDWYAISDADQNWRWECEKVLGRLKVSATTFILPAHSDELVSAFTKPYGVRSSSRVILNLHGAYPVANAVQLFSDNEANIYDFTIFQPLKRSIVFLFACYGGNSGWWNKHGVLTDLMVKGSQAVIASSSAVWCSSPSEMPDDDIPPGAVEICAEFFAALESGMSMGEALMYAKITTISHAVDSREKWFFCKTIKEVSQFSLFGAPWVRLKSAGFPKSNNQNQVPLRTLSVMESIRLSSQHKARVGKSMLLEQIREKIRQKLPGYVEYDLVSPEEIQSFSQPLTGTLDMDKDESLFQKCDLVERMRWSENLFYMATVPENLESGTGAELLILDENGQLIKRFSAKGNSNVNYAR